MSERTSMAIYISLQEYDEMRKKYEECKKQRDKILAEYRQEKVKYEPLNKKLTEAKARINEADNAMKSTVSFMIGPTHLITP